MRIAYIDEAGIGNPIEEPFSVVAGIIVHGDHQLSKVREKLKLIVDSYIPRHQRENFIFHAKEIFNGGGKVFDRRQGGLPLATRLEIAREIAAIPVAANLTIVVGWRERANFLAEQPDALAAMGQQERAIGPHLVSYLLCCTHIEHWMRQFAKKEHCILVVEDNPQARGRLVALHREHQSQKYVDALSEEAKRLYPFNHIVEDPLFQAKRSNSPLELADFFAYVGKRLLMRPDDPRFMPFFDQMKQSLYEYEIPKNA